MLRALKPDESAELVRLWQHRQALAPAQMGRLYGMVGDALASCHPPELKALGESRQELVAQFIYIKVLRLDVDPDDEVAHSPPIKTRAAHSAPSTAFALCAYFRRYLIDCTRAASFRRKLSIGDEVSEAQLESELGAHEDAQACLAEHGLTTAGVQAAARAFIAGLDEPERLLLCQGFGNESAGGLAGVAARHSIASYHYRAGRLGLVHKRSALPADYRKTLIGRWLGATLGLELLPENMAVILQVFEILGAEAS